MSEETSRPEIAFVLLLMQATFWTAAGISGLPFVLGGERYILVLAVGSFSLARRSVALAVPMVKPRKPARPRILALPSPRLAGPLLHLALPSRPHPPPVAPPL